MLVKFTDSDYGRVRRTRKGRIVIGHGPNDIGTAEWIVGGTSEPSKMPGPSYNLTTSVCHIGGKLRKVKGSVCEGCYADRKIPANLTIRVSGYMVDEAAPVVVAGLVTSTVTSNAEATGRECPAVKNHTSCNGVPMKDPKAARVHPACRACWNRKVANVNYGLHTAKVTAPTAADAGQAADVWGRQVTERKSLQEALATGTPVAV